MATTSVHDDLQPGLLQRVGENLVTRCRVRSGTRLLIAVSGGADSVALLRLLVDAAPRLQLQLAVAHFDHGLRPHSAAEARFVQKLAGDLDVQPVLAAWDTPRRGEDAARRARHAFLQETAVRLGCGAIALGHQRDDQIETTLLRLGRGSGPRGLLGMAWRRPDRVDLVRPLLDCPHAVLVDFLRQRGQTWCEDTSNQDLELKRNRIRHLALPALESALGPAWQANWSASLDDLRGLWDWLDTAAATLLERARRLRLEAGIEVCERAPLQEAPEILRRTALQRWLESAGVSDLRRVHLEGASNLVQNGQNGQSMVFPPGARLVLENERLLFVAAPVERGVKTAKPPYTLYVEAVGLAHALRLVEARRGLGLGAEDTGAPLQLPCESEVVLCNDALQAGLEVRAGLPGERVRLLGAPGSRRLARILQDKHLPVRLRRAWPVVADAAGIVWIPGAGIAERCRLGPESRGALRLALRSPSKE